MAQTFEVRTYNQGESIVTEGEVGAELIIVKSGSVHIMKHGQVIGVEFKNYFFGERSILLKSEIRDTTVYAMETDTQCWILSQERFKKVIDSCVVKTLVKRMQVQDSTIELTDLSVVKKLGSTAYGQAYLVIDKRNG